MAILEKKWVAPAVAKQELADLLAKRETRFQQLAQGRLSPVAGVVELIQLVRRTARKIALASSADTAVIYDNLRLAEINPALFDAIVDSTPYCMCFEIRTVSTSPCQYKM